MSQERPISGVDERLENELTDDARVLTDVEDRFVYANEGYFQDYEVIRDEADLPELVVRAKSSADAETAQRILNAHDYTVVYRQGWTPSDVLADGPVAVIDATDTYHHPVDIDKQTRAMDLSDLRLEHPENAAELGPDRLDGISVTKGFCPINQTTYGDVETYSAKGRLMVSRELATDGDSAIEHSEKTANILYSCASCGNCFRPMTEELTNMWQGLIEGKRRVVEDRDGKIPKTFRDVLDSTFMNGNPLQEPEKKREAWTDEVEVDVPILEPGDSVDALLFVGCMPSYDDRNIELAKSLARVFDALDVDWGILGNDESCAGNHQRVMGEEGLFEEMVERNGEAMDEIDYNQLVTADPHSYQEFKEGYAEYGVDLDPVHYTEFLVERLDESKLVEEPDEPKVVTYHDSCYLGTHNDVTAEPRDLLDALPGYEFRDIETTTLCCGGGGGRMWFEDEYVEDRPYEPVVDSAMDVEADVMALACPFCVTNFEDARKTMDLEDEFIVNDISELVAAALTDVAT